MIKENGLPPLYLLAHPRFGGGWRAQRARRGNQKAMINGGGNRLMFKGALPFIEAAYGAPLPPLTWSPSPMDGAGKYRGRGVVPPPCKK